MTCRNLSKWQSHRQCQVAKWSERTDSTVKVLVMLINLQATLGKWMDTDWCVQPNKFQFSLPWQCSSGVLSLVCKGSLTFAVHQALQIPFVPGVEYSNIYQSFKANTANMGMK